MRRAGALVAVCLAATGSTAPPTALPEVPTAGEPQMPSVADLIVAAAQRFSVDPRLAVEVAVKESGLNQAARSPKGAIGVMQLMPATASELGVDPYDLGQNIDGGVRYLRQQISAFGELPKALAAYNWGPESVRAAVAEHGDRWLAAAPAETRDYVNTILSRLGEWQPQFTLNTRAAGAAVSSFRRMPKQQQAVLMMLGIGLGSYYLYRLWSE